MSYEEFLKFLALQIFIGTIGYPRLEMYGTVGREIPSFPDNMTRFHLLHNNLKFSANDIQNDKLFEIRSIIYSLKNRVLFEKMRILVLAR